MKPNYILFTYTRTHQRLSPQYAQGVTEGVAVEEVAVEDQENH
jgi:hypothetical protein